MTPGWSPGATPVDLPARPGYLPNGAPMVLAPAMALVPVPTMGLATTDATMDATTMASTTGAPTIAWRWGPLQLVTRRAWMLVPNMDQEDKTRLSPPLRALVLGSTESKRRLPLIPYAGAPVRQPGPKDLFRTAVTGEWTDTRLSPACCRSSLPALSDRKDIGN
jgi:hypothetical protein